MSATKWVVLPVLEVACHLERFKIPLLPRFMAWLVCGKWLCRIVGHSTVRSIDYCFRCDCIPSETSR